MRSSRAEITELIHFAILTPPHYLSPRRCSERLPSEARFARGEREWPADGLSDPAPFTKAGYMFATPLLGAAEFKPNSS